jgi:hypothetical protein
MLEEEHDRTAVWLTVIDALLQESRAPRVLTVVGVIALLANVQFALRRWPWKERSRRGAMPSRWLIDDEADVQALLWTILAPAYGPDLVDETYLPHTGQVQPRADLAILSLRLIIEVKIVRTPADFRAVEEQVAGDSGLYFHEPGRFDRMVVFVYDDCDRPQPERYAGLVTALKRRERVADVVIIRRPSMISDRHERA